MRLKISALVALFLLLFVTAVYAVDAPEREVIDLVNAERAERGLPRLVVDGRLSKVAEEWSESMLSANTLAHNPDVANQVTGWTTLGENVGVGPTISAIHNAFMESPGHRDNVLDKRWDSIGVGVVRGNDRVWVTQLFIESSEAYVLSGASGLYVDDHKIASVHRDAVYSLKERGLMTGFGDGTFRPNEPVTRQQLASILHDILEDG